MEIKLDNIEIGEMVNDCGFIYGEITIPKLENCELHFYHYGDKIKPAYISFGTDTKNIKSFDYDPKLHTFSNLESKTIEAQKLLEEIGY